jgi:hypothetical protein
MTDGQALVLDLEVPIKRLHYLYFKPAEAYRKKVDFSVVVTYHDGRVTPAYLRQAARELMAVFAEIATELEQTKGEAYGD